MRGESMLMRVHEWNLLGDGIAQPERIRERRNNVCVGCERSRALSPSSRSMLAAADEKRRRVFFRRPSRSAARSHVGASHRVVLRGPRTLSRASGRTAARKRAASTNRRSRRRHTSREGHTFTPQVSLDKKLAQNFAQMLKLANWNGRCRRLNGE